MKNSPKKIANQTILVTGGSGLIGSSLIYDLQDKYKIICLDRGQSYAQVKKFFNNNVKFIKGDITNEELLDKIIRRCQLIIHLAGGGGNPACINDPVWAAQTHILGTNLLLKKALKYKIKKFIFASSQSVYTTFHKRIFPFKETIKLEPDDFYGTLKRIAEDLILGSGINYFILRFANVYGNSEFYPMPTGGAINNFIKLALEKQEIQIYGSGEQGIDFINLKDVVGAIILALEKKSYNNIYNVGSGQLVKIKDIAGVISGILRDKFNKEIKIKPMPAPSDKIWPDRLMSIEKIKKELGWKPKISLRAGLEEMIINYSNIK